MKKGAGDDPFADEPGSEPPGDTDAPTTPVGSATATASGPESDAEDPATDDPSESADPARDAGDLPYLARRQLKRASVKADRDQVPFFLRADVKRGERDLRRAVEDVLDQEVNKTDLREAAYVFAQRDPEGVADVLREWGIEYLD